MGVAGSLDCRFWRYFEGILAIGVRIGGDVQTVWMKVFEVWWYSTGPLRGSEGGLDSLLIYRRANLWRFGWSVGVVRCFGFMATFRVRIESLPVCRKRRSGRFSSVWT